MTGYSHKTLAEKLGFKSGEIGCFINLPKEVAAELNLIQYDSSPMHIYGYIHFFALSTREVENQFENLKNHLTKDGMLWVSWPKKGSKIPTDVNENIIRHIGLTNGLVDVKVCAINETWSGLKFVYRLKNR